MDVKLVFVLLFIESIIGKGTQKLSQNIHWKVYIMFRSIHTTIFNYSFVVFLQFVVWVRSLVVCSFYHDQNNELCLCALTFQGPRNLFDRKFHLCNSSSGLENDICFQIFK